jgi:hypothetical protein
MVCDLNESPETCSDHCKCYDESGKLDRTKIVNFGNSDCESTYVHFPGYDLPLDDVKSFFRNIIDVDTTLTNDDQEIWKRVKKVWNWASTNKVPQNFKGVNEETCEEFSTRRSIEILGKERYQGYAIQTVPEVFEKYGGLCYGFCTSHAHLLSMYFVIAGVPETRVASFGYNTTLYNSNHLFTGLLISNKWIYLDFTCSGVLSGDKPYSKGCILSIGDNFFGFEAYEHPNGASSIKNFIGSVPTLHTVSK